MASILQNQVAAGHSTRYCSCLTSLIQTCSELALKYPKASCNYINAIIGSGIIGMPYAIREAGLVLGLGGLCLVAWMTDYSMILMLKGAAIADTNSYQDLMAAAFGRVGFGILSVIQFMFPFVGKCFIYSTGIG